MQRLQRWIWTRAVELYLVWRLLLAVVKSYLGWGDDPDLLMNSSSKGGGKMVAVLAGMAFVACLLLPWGLAWLAFVYPHSGVSLKPVWTAAAGGLLLGLTTLLATCYAFYRAWPKD